MPAPPGQETPQASQHPEQAIRPEWPILRELAKPLPSLPERVSRTA
jgi:hypothetical protein